MSSSHSARALLHRFAPAISYGCLILFIVGLGGLARWVSGEPSEKPVAHPSEIHPDSTAIVEHAVPGGCLYQSGGTLAFVSHPCAGASFRAPQSYSHN